MPYNAKTDWKFDEIVTEHDMNRLEQGIKDAHTEGMDNPEPTALNLKYGTQVVQSDRIAPYNVVGFKGRTLVNLMGRDGGCESMSSIWASYASLFELDNSTFSSGRGSYKITITNGFTSGNINNNLKKINITAGQKYIFIADMKRDTCSYLAAYLAGTGMTLVSTPNYASNSWGPNYVVFNSGTATQLEIGLTVYGAAGQNGNVDNVRVYQITSSEYEAIPSMTADQIAAKWPYVDDMQPSTNPYVIKYGENLLPPFNEWSLHSDASIVEPYKAEFKGTGAYKECSYTTHLIPGQYYTGNTGLFFIRHYDAAGNILGEDSGGVTFKTPLNAIKQAVIFATAGANGTKTTLDRPMLNLGDTAKPFKPREDNYLFFPSQWCSNTDGSVADQLFRNGADYYKFSKFKTMDLDGNQPWVMGFYYNGFKQVLIPKAASVTDNPGIFVKYDGKILPTFAGIPASNDLCAISQSTGDIHVTIANTDSGWGDGYTPSQSEIQAYFYGWVMVNADTWNTRVDMYNGTGTKGWVKRWVGVGTKSTLPSVVGELENSTGTNILPTSVINNAYKPYKLQYQLAQPVLEMIVPEGDITLHEGLNQIEVGNGIIVREKANIAKDVMNPTVYINVDRNKYSNVSGSELKLRTKSIFEVYNGELKDTSWMIFQNTPNAYGNAFVTKSFGEYDPTAAYTVTYLALDRYSLTCNIKEIQGQFEANLKNNVDTLTRNQTDIVKRVSVLESTKVQKVQPHFIQPTLLNGWINYAVYVAKAGYYKDEMGIVHLSGLIKNGSTTISTILFWLPKGYRPALTTVFGAITSNGSTVSIHDLNVTLNGTVQIGATAAYSGFINLDGISFIAEQ